MLSSPVILSLLIMRSFSPTLIGRKRQPGLPRTTSSCLKTSELGLPQAVACWEPSSWNHGIVESRNHGITASFQPWKQQGPECSEGSGRRREQPLPSALPGSQQLLGWLGTSCSAGPGGELGGGAGRTGLGVMEGLGSSPFLLVGHRPRHERRANASAKQIKHLTCTENPSHVCRALQRCWVL